MIAYRRISECKTAEARTSLWPDKQLGVGAPQLPLKEDLRVESGVRVAVCTQGSRFLYTGSPTPNCDVTATG